jgi:hypothetical protein
LEDPEPELSDQAEQLARFIEGRQRTDGSINVSNSFRDDIDDSPGAAAYYPPEAIYALIRSHRQRPASWKLEVVRKSFEFYRTYWRDNPAEAFVPWMTSACAEAYFATKEMRFADFALEMADWTLPLQHVELREAARGWRGGFGSFQHGQLLATEPGITTASFCEGLADAYRVARDRGDAARVASYRQSLDLAAGFMLSIQYTPARVSHYAGWYGRRLVGGFWAGRTDGSLRIDQNQHAVNGLLHYLTFVIANERPDGMSPRKGPQAN